MVKTNRIFHKSGDLNITQPAFTDASVKIGFQFLSPLANIFNLEQVLPLTTTGSWKRISKADCGKLNQIRFVAVRQITALMPAREAIGLVSVGKWFIPLVFVVNQIAQILLLCDWRLIHCNKRSAEHCSA